MSAEVFAARSLILSESTTKRRSFLDRPWCKGDEYYIQKLALTLDGVRTTDWIDLSKVD